MKSTVMRTDLGTEERVLTCVLSGEEHRRAGIELAMLVAERICLEERLREARLAIEDVSARMARLAETVESESEERSVTCVLEADLLKGELAVVRTDTNEVVYTRALTAAEKRKNQDKAKSTKG